MNGRKFVVRASTTVGVPIGVALVLVVVAFEILAPAFRDLSNIANYVNNAVPLLLITVGVAIVIIAGGIDLSMGTVAGLSAGVSLWALVSGLPGWLAVFAGLGTGLAFGVLNGLLITLFGISDFIVTLGTLNVAAGLLTVLVQNVQLAGAQAPDFKAIGHGSSLGIPNAVWIAVVACVLVHFFLVWTVFGRRVFAIGIGAAAADSAGVRVGNTRLVTFAVSGLMAGTAGVVLASQLGAVQAALGAGLNLTAIAGAVIGGVSLAGGRGSVWAALCGGLLLATLQQGLRLMGVDAIYFTIVTGLCIVGGVVFDTRVQQFGLNFARKQQIEREPVPAVPKRNETTPLSSTRN